jgi:ribulose-phosphate 3-epimerase
MIQRNNNSAKVKISPSLLSADFALLGQEVKLITEAGADYIHLDIMDGHFVPNLTFGPDIVKSIRPYSNLPFDVHLMTENVDENIKNFAQAGADIITIHAESVTHLDRSLNLIRSLGKKAGIALVPSTHENCLDHILGLLDLVLVMSVNPGFCGQKFIHSQLNKIKSIATKIAGKNIELSVDGGVNEATAHLAIEAGANVLVSGSYIFQDGPDSYSHKISQLQK